MSSNRSVRRAHPLQLVSYLSSLGIVPAMSMKQVALATSAKWPLLPPDDAHLTRALTEAGLRPTPVVWIAENDWTAFDAVVIRSCWDYHRHLAEVNDPRTL